MNRKTWLATEPFWFRERGISVYLVDGCAVLVRRFRGLAPRVLGRVPILGLDIRETFQVIEECVYMALEKGAVRKVAGASALGLALGDFGLLHPVFFEYLSKVQWEDGSARQPSSFLVFNDGGQLKLMLRDKEAGLCLWIAGESIDELFALTEAALNDGETEWRVDRQGGAETAKRVKKK